MVNGLKFPSRLATLNHQRDTGTKDERLCGWPSKGVDDLKNRRDRDRKRAGQPKRKSSGVDRREKLCGELQDVRTVNRHRWVRRAASGERVKRGQGTRHNDPVTSEEGMLARV